MAFAKYSKGSCWWWLVVGGEKKRGPQHLMLSNPASQEIAEGSENFL